MNLLVCLYTNRIAVILVVVNVGLADILKKPDIRSIQSGLREGIEFNGVSRGTLLKLLTAMEENIHGRVRGGKQAVFTAQFANNKHTRKFIYPEAYGG